MTQFNYFIAGLKILGMLVAVLLIFQADASALEKGDMAAAVSAVETYNMALLRAYSSLDFQDLRKVTTDKEYNKVMIYIKSYEGLKQKIRARLLNFSIRNVSAGSHDGSVTTAERWSYERVDSGTGEIKLPERIYNYEMDYELLKGKDGDWKVDRLRIIKQKMEIRKDDGKNRDHYRQTEFYSRPGQEVL